MPKAVPIYGLGADPIPTFGQTTDDLKVGVLEGAVFSAQNVFQEMVGPRAMRVAEREQLGPVSERRKRAEEADPMSEFAMVVPASEDPGPTYSPEDATEYNKEFGLSYTTPQSKTQLDWDRDNFMASMQRKHQLARIQDGFIPKFFAFGGGMVGAMADPLTATTMLIPSLAQIRVARASLRAAEGLKPMATSLQAGRLTTLPESAPVVARALGADLGLAFAEGVAIDSALEIPNYFMAKGLQEEYTLDTLLFSTLASGTFNGVIQGGLASASRSGVTRSLEAQHKSLQGMQDSLIRSLQEENPIGVLKAMAEMDTATRLEVQEILRKATKEGGEAFDQRAQDLLQGRGGLEPIPDVGPQAPPLRGAGEGKAPSASHVRRRLFMERLQAGLDHDLYFGEGIDTRAFKKDLEAFLADQEAPKPTKSRTERKREARAEKKKAREEHRTHRQKEDARQKTMRGRYLDNEEFEEMAEGMLEGGLWRVDELEEIEPNPVVRQDKEDATDVFETSKKLDEVAEEAGVPEVKHLDRSRHLMKSIEMRLAATRVALADMLDGRGVNVNYLIREATLYDMHNRGLFTDAEFWDQAKKLSKEYKEELEDWNNYGIIRDKIEPVSDETMRKAYKEPTQKEIEEDIDTIDKFFDDGDDSEVMQVLRNTPEFKSLENTTKSLKSTSDLLKGEGMEDGVRDLAACMARIGVE
jgi:hypothetical protein